MSPSPPPFRYQRARTGRLPIREFSEHLTCTGWRESHARWSAKDNSRFALDHQARANALADKLREHGACGYALHSFLADSFARTRRPHFAGTRFGFACYRQHPKQSAALRAAATKVRRQTARHGERSLRLRCSCLRVWACSEPFVVARRLSWRRWPDSELSTPFTPLRFAAGPRTAPRPCCFTSFRSAR